MKARIMAILLIVGFAFSFPGCYGSDSSSLERIPLEAFDPSTIDTANWMSKLNDNRTLNEIILPGSHDSGMSTCKKCTPYPFFCIFSQTQALDIEHQLLAGTRYFDIRLAYKQGTILTTYHRTDGDGCDGETFPKLIEGAARFLILHPTEFVIFKFSHWRKDSGYFRWEAMWVLDECLKYWEAIFKNGTGRELLYKKPVSISDNILSTPVSELRGKIVAVFHNFVNDAAYPPKDYYEPSTGRFFYSDVGRQPVGEWWKFNFPVYDEYSDTPYYVVMKKDQL